MLDAWNSFYQEAVLSSAAQGIKVDEYERLTDGMTYEKAYLSTHTTSLFLLRSTRNNNTLTPDLTWIDMVPKFDASGWINENPMGTIYTDYFAEYLKGLLDEMLYKNHESKYEYHKFGTLSAYADMDEKVLRTDMSNIDPDRKGFHFPGHTYTIAETNTILDGQCRQWDCGLLEYTIEFKLGTDSEVMDSYNEDGTVRRLDQIDVNYLNLKRKAVILDDNFVYDNSDYYLSEDDADIFKIKDGTSRSMNNIVQVNTNKKINALQGTIRFPMPFIDTNYAIFCQTPPCVCYAGSEEIEQNVNQMVFVNKSNQSVTALLIIPTYEGSEPKLLYTNRFRMQVVGRWKKTKEELEKEAELKKQKEYEEAMNA